MSKDAVFVQAGRWLKPPPAVMFRKWWPAHHTSTVDKKKSSSPPGMWSGWSMFGATCLRNQATDQRYLSDRMALNQLKHRVFHFLGVGFSFQKKTTAFQIHPPGGGYFFFIRKRCHTCVEDFHILDRIDVMQTLLSLVLCGLYAPWSCILGWDHQIFTEHSDYFMEVQQFALETLPSRKERLVFFQHSFSSNDVGGELGGAIEQWFRWVLSIRTVWIFL